MHNYLINASIQVVPISTDKHPYEWVDEAIHVIANSGIKYEVGPFATILEGTYEEVFKVIHDINETLLNKGCPEWITNLQVQLRNDRDVTGDEKVDKFRIL